MQDFRIDPISQFKVRKILNISIFDFDISITNSTLMMLVGTVGFIIFTMYAVKKQEVIPNKLQSFIEVIYIFIHKLCKENINQNSEKYESIIATVFLYILIGNLLGMIPFGFTFTSQITVTFLLAIIVFSLSIFIGIFKNGIKFFKNFFPSNVPIYLMPLLMPIEIISFISRPFSLGIRLFANIVAGHAMIKVFGSFVVILGAIFGLIPFSMSVILTGFEIMVAFLQSYIFAILSCIYISEAINLH